MPCALVSHPRGSSEVSDGGHVSKVKRSWGCCGWTVGDYHSKHIIMLSPRIKFGFHGSSFTKGILFINSNCGVVAQRAGNLNLWQSYTQRFHLAITWSCLTGSCLIFVFFKLQINGLVLVWDPKRRKRTDHSPGRMSAACWVSFTQFFLVNNRFMISFYSSWLEGNNWQLYFTDRVECLNWDWSSFITCEASKIYWLSVVDIFLLCVSQMLKYKKTQKEDVGTM